MKIIVNATPMLKIATGIGRYLKELYSTISRLHPEHEIRCFEPSLADTAGQKW
jgi:glycosyltransferase involved in cell wall biosynthesis